MMADPSNFVPYVAAHVGLWLCLLYVTMFTCVWRVLVSSRCLRSRQDGTEFQAFTSPGAI